MKHIGRRQTAARAPLVVLLAMLCGCAEGGDGFAAWTIPIPDGTPILEYQNVAFAERQGKRVGMEQDLVIGLDPDDPEQHFYGLVDVAVDRDGNIYVLDAGNYRVQVFDPQGRFTRSFGTRGPGPGEFDWPKSIALAGDLIVVLAGQTRLSIWNLQGEHVDDAFTYFTTSLRELVTVQGDTVIAAHTHTDFSQLSGPTPERALQLVVSSVSPQAVEDIRYVSLPLQPWFKPTPGRTPAPVPQPFATFAAAPTGDLYISGTDEYQLLSLATDGNARWALRVADSSPVLTETDRVAAQKILREEMADVAPTDVEWPERPPALTRLAVDGHGHVYVYPHDPAASSGEDRPVDVYSASGELLFAGLMPDIAWVAARGDFVYGRDINDVTEEAQVTRWRLIEPFD